MKRNLERRFSTFDLLLVLALVVVLVVNIAVSGSLPDPGMRKASRDAVTVTGTGTGKVGDVVVEVTADKSNIYSVKVLEQNETPGIGSLAVEQLPGAIVGANSLAVDSVATATVTSDAIKSAVRAALTEAGFNPADFGYVEPTPAPTPEPTPAPTPKPEAAAPAGDVQTATGTGTGIDGAVVVEVKADASTIYEVNVLEQNETPGIGSVAVEKIPGAMVEANSIEVDGISGATVTSTAIKNAVAEALTSMGFDPASYQGAAAAPAGEKQKEAVELECDVVVVGAGGAGLTASVLATQQGMDVILLEKMPFVGGNSLRAEGGMNAANTSVQKELGIAEENTVDNFVEDTLRLGHNLGNPDLVRTLAENSAEAVDWLFSIDAPLTKVKATGGTTHKYLHQPADGSAVGSYLVAKLSAQAEKLGIDVRVNTKATEILMEGGQAVGVMAEDDEHIYTVKAKSVVIATGGFGANFDLMASYDPSLANAVTTNHAGAQGDGIMMAQAVGADTVDMEQIQLHPTVIQSNGLLVSESLRSYGAVIVNTEGKRFVNDLAGRDVVSQAELKQPNGYCFIIFDQNMVDNLALTHKFIDGGYTLTGESYEELAEAMGLEGDAIQNFVGTMNAWNESCEKGEDAEWGRNNGMEKLALAPFYAIKIAPGIHHTMGGIKINTAAEVIDTDGNVIPGLFACGETTGGIHGGNRVGGNAVCDFIVFGRIAGQSASDFAKGGTEAVPAAPADGVQTASVTVAGVFGEPIVVEVSADASTIHDVKVLEQNETPGIGAVAAEDIPAAIVAANSVEVDAMTGATVTSTAIKNAVAEALSSMGFDPASYQGAAAAPAPEAPASEGSGAMKVQTMSGVTVTHAADWAEQFPEQYNSWMMTKESSEAEDYLELYPMLRTLYEGYGFAKDYKAARGHYYDVQDIEATGRPHPLANCWTCKTPDFTNMVNEEGIGAYQKDWAEVQAQITEGISCYTCHANNPGPITVTHTYWIDAVGDDFDKIAPANLACGQCHNEYYFAPDTKATTIAHNSLASMAPETMLAYFNDGSNFPNGEPFADWTNPRTGVKQIKVQHPEFETFLGAGSPHANTFTCADCHMPVETAADGSTYHSHNLISPLDNPALLESTCSVCHKDLEAEVRGVQQKVETRTYEVGYELEYLTELLAQAVESGKYTDEDLAEIRQLARDGQFYWDFVFVENAEGVHNPSLTYDCLDRADALCSEATQLLFALTR